MPRHKTTGTLQTLVSLGRKTVRLGNMEEAVKFRIGKGEGGRKLFFFGFLGERRAAHRSYRKNSLLLE